MDNFTEDRDSITKLTLESIWFSRNSHLGSFKVMGGLYNALIL